MKSIKGTMTFLFMCMMISSIGFAISIEDQQKLNLEERNAQEQIVQNNSEKSLPIPLYGKGKVDPNQEKIEYYNRYGYPVLNNNNTSSRDCAAGDPEYTWTCGGGSWDSEISWSLSDGTADIAGTGVICLADGDYTLTMNDAYGDGWNGGSWSLTDVDGTVVASSSLDAGATGDYAFTLGGAPPVSGCTDATAENFDADATMDDGSCTWNGGCASSSYTSCASGDECVPVSYWCDGSNEFGNAGWGPDCTDGSDEGEGCCDAGNSAYGDCADIYDCAGVFAGSSELGCDDVCDSGAVVDGCGECGGDGTSCAGSEYTVTCGGGSWDSEISWSLTDATGAEVLAGGAPFSGAVILEDGDYTLTGTDAYGDGWNGGSWNISSADGSLYTYAVEGESGTWTFSLPGEVDTNVYGCMDPGAAEYNAEATVDDGSCLPYPGADCGYWNADLPGFVIGCASYYCFDPVQIGDGTCDVYYGGPYGLNCEENSFDGCDCGTQGDDPTAPCYEEPVACLDTECTLSMVDAYGDGWNGATWDSGDQSASLASGADGTASLCFDMTAANAYSCGGGSWDSEISWTLSCTDGTELSGAAPDSGCFGNCEAGGCMDETACNFDAGATFDDGSCYQPFCDGSCDSGAVVDDCGECGGDGTACADCAYPTWFADGYCDASNNDEVCGFDGGDCCPGDCVDASYDCATYGGDCSTCLDPASADNAPGGECDIATATAPENLTCAGEWSVGNGPEILLTWDASADADSYEVFYFFETCEDQGLVTCLDGSCQATEADCPAATCGDIGGNEGWIADGYCDSINNNETCGFDGGDCCASTCVDADYACDASTGPCAAADCQDPNGNNDSCGELGCVDTTCGYYLNYGYTCDDLAYYGIDCTACADEGACGGTTGCGADEFTCADGGCIPASYYCDGSVENGNAGWSADCGDGSDENVDECCALSDGTGPYDDAFCGNDPDPTECTGLTVLMNDAYGDGWNGNVLTIGDTAFELLTGSTATGCYEGPMDVTVFCEGGQWQSEVSWSISDAAGNELLAGGAPYGGCLGDCGAGIVISDNNYITEEELAIQMREKADRLNQEKLNNSYDINISNPVLAKMQDENVYYMNILNNLGLTTNTTREWLSLGTTTETTMTITGVGDTEWSFGVTALNMGGSSDMTTVDGCSGGDEPVAGGLFPMENLSATGECDDYDGDGVEDNAVSWTWTDPNEPDPFQPCEDGSEPMFDCVGTPFCNAEPAFTGYDCFVGCENSYLGDTYCDDGTWGVDFQCEEYSNDCDDCGGGDMGDINGYCGGTTPTTCADGEWECADGGCIPASYYCDGSVDNGNASWGPDCADGSDEVMAECCDNGSYDAADCGGGTGGGAEACADAGGFYCGDDEANWTQYSPEGCVPANYICDGWEDCVDASDEADCAAVGCAESTCGYYLNYGYTCDDLAYYGIDCTACAAEGACGGGVVVNDGNGTASEKLEFFNDVKEERAELYSNPRSPFNLVNPPMIVDVAGNVLLDPTPTNRTISYEVHASCDACLDGGPWENTYTSASTDFLVYGFDEGNSACAEVRALSDLSNEVSEWSGSACANAGCGPDCVAGDANGDLSVNVSDIVILVNVILNLGGSTDGVECADMNGDTSITVTDIVAIIQIILNPMANADADATDAQLNLGSDVTLSSNGQISAIQMVLSHDSDFSLELTQDAWVADYATTDNKTTLIVVMPNSDFVFTPNGEFTIEETIILSSTNEIDVTVNAIPVEFSVSNAYPNPFNPVTAINISLPADGLVNVSVYNVAGQMVDAVFNNSLTAGSHSITWDAGNLSSGVYLIRTEAGKNISTQKVMLLK